MKTEIYKKYKLLTAIFIVTFALAYIVCGFFNIKGQEVVAHITGCITMSGCFIASLAYMRMPKKNLIFKLIGFSGNFGMAGAYFLYIFNAISPSNFIIKSHAASSMLFDITTLLLSVTTMLALIILNMDDKEND